MKIYYKILKQFRGFLGGGGGRGGSPNPFLGKFHNFKSTKCINVLPTCVTDHPLDDDVHEEAVVVRGVDLLHHVLSHLNRFMIEKPHNSQKGEHVAI